MDNLFKALAEMISSGNIIIPVIIISIIGVIGLLFLIVKLIGSLKSAGLISSIPKANKEDITAIKELIERDNNTIRLMLGKIETQNDIVSQNLSSIIIHNEMIKLEINKIDSIISELKASSQADIERINNIAKDINNSAGDSKVKQAEISSQIQDIHKDLASLHGTILAIGSGSRTNLK